MEREFIELDIFTKRWKDLELTDDDLANLQSRIAENPKIGKVIKNTGGMRKVRIEQANKGKRGGARVLYVDIVVREKVYLLAVYLKSKDDNISDSEAKTFKKIIDMIKKNEESNKNG